MQSPVNAAQLVKQATPFRILNNDLTYITGQLDEVTKTVKLGRTSNVQQAIKWTTLGSQTSTVGLNNLLVSSLQAVLADGTVTTLQSVASGGFALSSSSTGKPVECVIITPAALTDTIEIITSPDLKHCLSTASDGSISFTTALCWMYRIEPVASSSPNHPVNCTSKLITLAIAFLLYVAFSLIGFNALYKRTGSVWTAIAINLVVLAVIAFQVIYTK